MVRIELTKERTMAEENDPSVESAVREICQLAHCAVFIVKLAGPGQRKKSEVLCVILLLFIKIQLVIMG